MNINYKQPQFELFPANSATLEDVDKPRILLANLTIPIESLVILTILGIMMALFAFSIGVERGKHLAAQALDERVSAAWNLAPHKPALPVVKKVAVVAPVVSQRKVLAQTVQPVAVKTTPVVAAGRFTVQLSSNKSESFAKQEAMDLRAKGFKTFLIKKGNFWLVCLGPFQSQEAAKGALKQAPAKYRSSSVRRF